MNILLATGYSELDESLLHSLPPDSIVSLVCSSKEEVLHGLKDDAQHGDRLPDIAVLSQNLPGDTDILEVVYSLRMESIRVIFLASAFSGSDPVLRKILDMGVYDFIPDTVTVGDILEKVKTPSSFKEAQQLFNGIQIENVSNKTGNFNKIFYLKDARVKSKRRKDIMDNLIGIWSPTSSGKTMTAINLAAVLADDGFTVALVDLDLNSRAVHTWLNVPSGEEAFFDVFKCLKEREEVIDFLSFFYRNPEIPEMWILTADPLKQIPDLKEKAIIQFLRLLSEEVDYVVVDTSRLLSDIATKTVLKTAEKVVLMTDLDYHHLLNLQVELDKMENDFDLDKFILVLNRYIDTPMLGVADVEKAAAMPVAFCMPQSDQIILESIKGGIPAVLFSAECKKNFRQMSEAILRDERRVSVK